MGHFFDLCWKQVFANNEQNLRRVRAFSVSHPSPPPVRKQRVLKELGRNTAGTADLHWPKTHSIPYGITLSMQSCGKNKEGEISGLIMFVFQVIITQDGARLFWTWLKSCLMTGSMTGWMYSLFCFACVCSIFFTY